VRPMHRMIAHSAFIIVSRRLSDTVVALPPSPIEDERVIVDDDGIVNDDPDDDVA